MSKLMKSVLRDLLCCFVKKKPFSVNAYINSNIVSLNLLRTNSLQFG